MYYQTICAPVVFAWKDSRKPFDSGPWREMSDRSLTLYDERTSTLLLAHYSQFFVSVIRKNPEITVLAYPDLSAISVLKWLAPDSPTIKRHDREIQLITRETKAGDRLRKASRALNHLLLFERGGTVSASGGGWAGWELGGRGESDSFTLPSKMSCK